MQVVINTCFLLNPGKKFTQIRLVVFEKAQKTHTLVQAFENQVFFVFFKLRTSIKINTRQFFNIGIYIHLRNQPRQRESNSEA